MHVSLSKAHVMQEVTWRGSDAWLQHRACMYPTRSLHLGVFILQISLSVLFHTTLTRTRAAAHQFFPVSRHVRTCSWMSAPIRCSLAWYVCMGVCMVSVCVCRCWFWRVCVNDVECSLHSLTLHEHHTVTVYASAHSHAHILTSGNQLIPSTYSSSSWE